MTLQESAIKVIEANGRRHVFVEWGVVIYDLSWREISRARLGNVACGAINDLAIWFGTSNNGVWRLPLNTIGDATDSLVLAYHTGSTIAIQSLAVQSLAGIDTHLLIGTDAGADFIADASTVYRYINDDGVDACAINSTKIAYGPGSAGGLHVLNHPTADWDSGDATVLNTGSSPAIIGNTVQELAYGTDLFVATSAGISVYDGSAVTDIAAATSAEASSINTTTGTPSGDITDIQTQDGTYFTVGEVTGTPGFVVDIVFNSVSTAATYINIYGRYQGNAGHTVNVKAWDFNTASWDILGTMPHNTSDAQFNFALTDADHRSSGEVRIQIEHTSSGNVNHDLYLDHVDLSITAATVNDTRCISPAAAATRTTGHVAYGTADDADGGRCVIYDIDEASDHFSSNGDTFGIWADDDLQYLICNATLTEFLQFNALVPAHKARSVARDFSIYAEVIDNTGGINSGTVVLKVNGSTVSPTVTAITNGYKVEFTPASASDYDERVVCLLSATDGDGNAVSREWSFVTEAAPAATVSDVKPPNIVAIRDISLTAPEADELIGSIYVVWGDEVATELIVSDAQAEAIGTIALDKTTYHETVHTLKIADTDNSGTPLATGFLQEGETVAITCAALGLSATVCEVLAIQRTEDLSNGLEYTLVVAEYEAV